MGKPDILVYVRGGENEELRYAIRSWCENLNFGKLCVVGGPIPDWCCPDIHIHNPMRWNKMRQALDNVQLGLKDNRLSKNILLMMDDVFVVERLGDWPEDFNFNRGSLKAQIDTSVKAHRSNGYNQLLIRTYNLIETAFKDIGNSEFDPLSFEEHAPFWCNRKKMLEVIGACGERPYDVLYRTIYGNTMLKNTKYKLDYKARQAADVPPKGAPILSSNDVAFNNGQIGTAIRDWFPTPSRYER